MYKLLIVDDNSYERNGISKLNVWEKLGFDEVYLAENGQKGLEMALRHKPLLIITDVQMPVMDGLTMAEKILEELPKTKFIFMSCFDDSEYLRGAMDVNAYSYILKPVDITKLINVIEKILRINAEENAQTQHISILEKQIEENIPILREQLIRDIFYGNVKKLENDSFASLNIEIKSYCVVSVLEVDDFESENSDKNMYFTINKIRNFFDKNYSAERLYTVALNKKRIGILYYCDLARSVENAEDECLELFGKIKDDINEELSLDITICIGGAGENYEEICNFFNQAEDMLDTSLLQKKNIIVFVGEVKANENVFDYNVIELESELELLIESGNKEEIDKFADKYYSLSIVQNSEVVRRLTLTVIGILQAELFKRNYSFADVFDDDFEIWRKLSEFDSILNIRCWIQNVLTSICEFVEDKNTGRHTKLVHRIKKVIDEEYAQISTVSEVASKVFFSTVHANTIFKRYTGETIFNYLTKRKIESAKELLREENSRVYEVAERVGYQSKTYFSALFKEYTGMTPREYRERENERR